MHKNIPSNLLGPGDTIVNQKIQKALPGRQIDFHSSQGDKKTNNTHKIY